MYVRDLMRREVVTLDVADKLDLADDIMHLGRIRHLPVVSGERVVGILSQRDLFRAAVSSLLQLRGLTGRQLKSCSSNSAWISASDVAWVMVTGRYVIASATRYSRNSYILDAPFGADANRPHLVSIPRQDRCQPIVSAPLAPSGVPSQVSEGHSQRPPRALGERHRPACGRSFSLTSSSAS